MLLNWVKKWLCGHRFIIPVVKGGVADYKVCRKCGYRVPYKDSDEIKELLRTLKRTEKTNGE